MSKQDIILQIIGIVVLSGLAVFFALIEAKYNKEFIDIGIVIGILGSLIGHHTYRSLKKESKDDTS